MANSGFSELLVEEKGGSSEATYLKFTWERTQVLYETNQSVIEWKLIFYGINGGSHGGTIFNQLYKVVIDGQIFSDFTSVKLSANSSRTLASGKATVPNTKEGNCSFKYTYQQDFGGITDYRREGDGTATLDPIDRWATITGAVDFNDEENPIISYKNPSGASITSLTAAISFDDSDSYLVGYRGIDVTGNTYTFNLTDAERNALRRGIKTGSSKPVKFYLKSSIDGITQTRTITKTLSLINYKPVLNPTVEDTNPITIALTGDKNILVKHASNAYYSTNAVGQKQATISSYVVQNSTTSTTATGTLMNVQSDTFYFDVTDSRGHTSSALVIKELVEYIPITCSISSTIPTTSGNATITIKGNCYYGSFGSQNNTLTLRYRYRTDGAYTDWKTVSTTINSDGTYNLSYYLSGLDYTKTHTFEAWAEDKLQSVYSSEYQVASVSIFDWGKDDFNFNVPVNFNKGFTQPTSALKQLWNGNSKMESSTTTINLIETVSSQANGIVLVFTPYNNSTNLANDEKLMSFFVSKKAVAAMPRKMHTFLLLEGSNFSGIGAKSLYIADEKISGYTNNVSSGTANGITYNNNNFVLRYILGV